MNPREPPWSGGPSRGSWNLCGGRSRKPSTAGRQAAFAANFMPLLDLGTEFASKWVALCEAHLGDTGITDPIRCFEYMGCFYEQEGNKRVSVLKFLDAPTVSDKVTRLYPGTWDSVESRLYGEFCAFWRV